MATAYVEPPLGWGPRQIIMTRLERLGYHVDQVGIGEIWRLVIR